MGERTTKLTKKTVDAASAEPSRYILWDSDLPGFGLRIERSGRKTFLVRYRTGGGRSGRQRQMTVGRYGVPTADQARIEARRLLAAAATGADPVAERQRARHEPKLPVVDNFGQAFRQIWP